MTPRAYLDLFFPLVENRQVRRALVLMGPRRVGKTVMLHHAIQRLLDSGVSPKHICYFSVDLPVYGGMGLEPFLDVYQEASEQDWHKTTVYAFFDEIQYLKNWESHLKAIVDSFPNVKCVVSGSAAAALKLKSSESGAGRFTDFLLPPLTFKEYLDLTDQTQFALDDNHYSELNEAFIDYINYGGYPEAIFSSEIQSDPGRFIKSDIIDKVLLRDLPSLYGIQDVQELNYLFTTLAFNTAREVSLEGLSQKSGVSKNTIKKYIEYLEAAFLIRVVHRVDRNARRFKRAARFKVYLTNPSMRAALFGPIKADDEDMGHLVETAIFSQYFHDVSDNIHYARWKTGEIDMVWLDANQKVVEVMEVKWSDRYYERPQELENLIDFCTRHNLRLAHVSTRSIADQIDDRIVLISFMPASIICFISGEMMIKKRRVSLAELIEGIKRV